MSRYGRKTGVNGPQQLGRIRLIKRARIGPPPLPAVPPSRPTGFEDEAGVLAAWLGERRELDDIVFVDSCDDGYSIPTDDELMLDDGEQGVEHSESLAPVALETKADDEWEEEDDDLREGEGWSSVLAFSASAAAVVLCGAFAIAAVHQPRAAASMMLRSIEPSTVATERVVEATQPVVLPEVVIEVATSR